MFDNALKFNAEDSQIYEDAVLLKVRHTLLFFRYSP